MVASTPISSGMQAIISSSITIRSPRPYTTQRAEVTNSGFITNVTSVAYSTLVTSIIALNSTSTVKLAPAPTRSSSISSSATPVAPIPQGPATLSHSQTAGVAVASVAGVFIAIVAMVFVARRSYTQRATERRSVQSSVYPKVDPSLTGEDENFDKDGSSAHFRLGGAEGVPSDEVLRDVSATVAQGEQERSPTQYSDPGNPFQDSKSNFAGYKSYGNDEQVVMCEVGEPQFAPPSGLCSAIPLYSPTFLNRNYQALANHTMPLSPFAGTRLRRSHARYKSMRKSSKRYDSTSSLSAIAATKFPALPTYNSCLSAPSAASERVSCVFNPFAEPFEDDVLPFIDTRTETQNSVMVSAPPSIPHVSTRHTLPIPVSVWSASTASTNTSQTITEVPTSACIEPTLSQRLLETRTPLRGGAISAPRFPLPSPSPESPRPTNIGWDAIKRFSQTSSSMAPSPLSPLVSPPLRTSPAQNAPSPTCSAKKHTPRENGGAWGDW
ncbi:hypothetical protein ACN47E_002128 [Coniothyrium glycines]